MCIVNNRRMLFSCASMPTFNYDDDEKKSSNTYRTSELMSEYHEARNIWNSYQQDD